MRAISKKKSKAKTSKKTRRIHARDYRDEIPNDDLIRTLKQAEKDIKNGKGKTYTSMEELFKDLGCWKDYRWRRITGMRISSAVKKGKKAKPKSITLVRMRLDDPRSEIPNDDLVKAIQHAERYERRKNKKVYTNMKDFLKDLGF